MVLAGFFKKELIKEAVEFHLLQASSFTSLNSSENLSKLPSLLRQKENLTKDLNRFRSERVPESELGRLEAELARVNKQLERKATEREAFEKQKVKNEKIVRECQELLARLED